MKDKQPKPIQNTAYFNIANASYEQAFNNVLAGTINQVDENRATRAVYYSWWGLDYTEGCTPHRPQTEMEHVDKQREAAYKIFSSAQPLHEHHTRYGRLYQGMLKRIPLLNMRVDASETGEIVFHTHDIDANRVETRITSNTIEAFHTMATRMRNTLYDDGQQSTVNEIHKKTGTVFRNDGGYEINISVQKPKGGENK